MSDQNRVEPSRDDTIVITQNTLYYFGIAVVFFVAGFLVAWVIFSNSGGNINPAEIRNAASEGARAAVQAELAALRAELGGGAQPTPAMPSRVDVELGNSPFWGPENAKVTVVMFSDFECSFCARFYRDTYGTLKARYQDRVRFVFKHFPLSAIHPNAERAAVAAECANEQGKFWAYHDVLFENQRNFSQDALISYARQVNVPNIEQFTECLTTQKYLSTVIADVQQGERHSVQGTPTFFINGLPLVGAQPYPTFERAIEQALAAAN
ncbi:MAG: thioredoxin domain-containing protein [Anaerolineae bacterium]|nr:DsbA family protein [Anaerolineae bacterium]MDW8298951.1 thioredoxin domain-containing protein [Anaerolineae bacterium]